MLIYVLIICLVIEMDVSDELLWSNKDWDPSYLTDIVTQDFYDFSELWNCGNVPDQVLIKEADKVDRYCPIVEDISLDDDTLCTAVEKIEKE